MKRPRIKLFAIYLLSLGWINWLVVGFVRAVPAGKWRVRLPVMGVVARLDLGQNRTIDMVHANKCYVAREIYWHDGRLNSAADRRALKLAIDLSDRPGTFLDIGSYTGLFALAVARCRPSVTAHAFEIVPENYLILWENTVGNDLVSRVRLHLTGIGGEPSSVRMPIGFGPGVLASSADLGSETSGADGVQIPVATIDTLFESLPSKGEQLVMKIDVEAYEWPVLKGGAAIIDRMKPDIICEILRRAPAIPEIEDFLQKNGYSAYRITDGGLVGPMRIVPVKHERDWLFTRRSRETLEALGHPVRRAPTITEI